jgi:hypothetical protein
LIIKTNPIVQIVEVDPIVSSVAAEISFDGLYPD